MTPLVTLVRERALAALHFTALSEMQEEALRVSTTARDVLLTSPTGSGKTLAFLLPLFMSCLEEAQRCALILSPTRELALQIADVWQRLQTGHRVVVCLGGHDSRIESRLLESAQQEAVRGKGFLLVGTPGRLKDHLERGHLEGVTFARVVVDEFDKALELGFEDDMRVLFKAWVKADTPRCFTSATHAIPIAPWTGFHDFVHLDYNPAAPSSDLSLYRVDAPIADKLDTLRALLLSLLTEPDNEAQASALVFANYREAAERINHYLTEQGIPNALYHGGLSQPLRERALIRLRGGSVRVLVATDLGSRGLDLPEVAYVVHYHFPQSEEAYTHRNGRTARAGKTGAACVIVGPDEVLPEYFPTTLPYYHLRHEVTTAALNTPFATLYIGRGKREKISRGDVVGFLIQCGGLTATDIGKIEVTDHAAFAAIRLPLAHATAERLRGQKIKGEKTHFLLIEGS